MHKSLFFLVFFLPVVIFIYFISGNFCPNPNFPHAPLPWSCHLPPPPHPALSCHLVPPPQACETGMSKVVLTVFNINTLAVQFYKRLGYKKDSTCPGPDEKPAYVILSKATVSKTKA